MYMYPTFFRVDSVGLIVCFRTTSQHWNVLNNEKTLHNYGSVLARLLKVALMSVQRGVLEKTDSPETLGSVEYRLLLTEEQVAAGNEVLKAHKS